MSDTEKPRGTSKFADDVDMEKEFLSDGCAEDPLATYCPGTPSSSGDPDSIERMVEQVPVKQNEFDIASLCGDKWQGFDDSDPEERILNLCAKNDCDLDEFRNPWRNDMYVCVFLVYKRGFKGQTSGAYIARWEISANSSEEFLTTLWNLTGEHLHREMVFEASADGDSTPKWSTKKKPTKEDLNKFALFQSGRRYYKAENIQDSKHNLLQNWRDKEISLYLHVYSLNVSNRAIWNTVKESLIEPNDRDRSGAASTQALLDLTEGLRRVHGGSLEAHGMAWTFWANAIQSAPAYKRSSMMQYPSQTLAGLFKAKEGIRVNAIKRELETANNVNDSYHEDIVALRKAFNTLRASVNSNLNALDHRIEMLEIRERTSSNLISAMKSTVAVQEDDIGKQLRN